MRKKPVMVEGGNKIVALFEFGADFRDYGGVLVVGEEIGERVRDGFCCWEVCACMEGRKQRDEL